MEEKINKVSKLISPEGEYTYEETKSDFKGNKYILKEIFYTNGKTLGYYGPINDQKPKRWKNPTVLSRKAYIVKSSAYKTLIKSDDLILVTKNDMIKYDIIEINGDLKLPAGTKFECILLKLMRIVQPDGDINNIKLIKNESHLKKLKCEVVDYKVSADSDTLNIDI